MAEFSKLIITGKGQTLIAKMIAENAGMEFTKIATSGTMYKPEQLEGLEALADIKQTSLIAKITRTNDVAVKIETSFNNLELTEGYYMRALGLYADDPDEGEILYAVTTEVSGNCYIPPYNGVTVSGAYVKLITTVGNAQHVSLEVDAAATATIGNIQDLRDNLDTVEISFTDEEVTERENIQPRDTLGTICRKIKKWLSDLKTGAFASVVDNCTTTEEGTVLDGRQGKALQDQITELREADGEINSNMGWVDITIKCTGYNSHLPRFVYYIPLLKALYISYWIGSAPKNTVILTVPEQYTFDGRRYYSATEQVGWSDNLGDGYAIGSSVEAIGHTLKTNEKKPNTGLFVTGLFFLN